MSDHLPECPKRFLPPENTGVCVCRWLQACEQRVRDEHSEVDAYRGWVKGYAAGVQAAREAVADSAVCHDCMNEDALAAIDALRGESGD